MSNPEESEDIKLYKKEINELDILLKTDKEPLIGLNWIKKELSQEKTHPRYIYFTENVLGRALETILSRADYSDSIIQEIVNTLKFITDHCSDCVVTANFAPNVLLIIFDTSSRPKFYQFFGKKDHRLYDDNDDDDRDVYLNRDWNLSRHLLSCVKLFIKKGAEGLIIERIKATNQNKENPEKLPFPQFKIYCKLLERVHDLLEEKRSAVFIQSSVSEMCGYFLRLTSEEMKTVEKKHILDVIQWMKGMLIRQYGKSSKIPYIVMEKYQLNLAFQWLQLPFIQKRVAGLTEINEYCQYLINPNQSRDIKYIDSDYVIQWIKEKKLIEYIFGDTGHPELIKRCRPILRFLAFRDEITEAHLDLMWAASIGKHESIMHEVWEIIGSMVDCLNVKLLDYIFEKIRSIPYTTYDVQFLDFLTKITDRGLTHNYGLDPELKKWYGVDILWYGLENDLFNTSVSTYALNTFCLYLSSYNCKKIRTPYLLKVIDNIKGKKIVVNSLMLLQSILISYDSKDDLHNSAMSVTLQLDRELGLLDILVNSIVSFSNDAVARARDEKIVDINSYVFNDHYSYLNQMKWQLDVLDYILRSTLQLNVGQMDILWDAIIENSLTEHAKNYAYDWIQMGVRPRMNYPAFDEEVLTLLFSKKIPKINFSTISMNGSNLVVHLFKFLNCGTLEFSIHPMTNVESFIVRSQKFEGLDYIWRLAVESELKEVGESAIDLLTKLQQNISPILDDQLPQIREEYIKRCMDYLGEYGKQHALTFNCQQQIQRCLLILQNFIDLFNTTNSEKHGAISRGNKINLTIGVLSSSPLKLEMYDTETLGDLKLKIAKHFDIEVSWVSLVQSKQKVTEDSKMLLDFPNLLKEPIFCVRRKPSVGSSSSTTPGSQQSNSQSSKSMNNNNNNNNNANNSLSGVSAVSILSSEVYFKQLFKLLSLPHPISEGIWDIIMRLPTNTHMKALLTDIQPDKVNNWNEILDPSNCFALYYCLQIVDSLACVDDNDSAEKKHEKLTWHQKFITCEGLKHLVSIFQTTDFLSVNFGSKRYVCFSLLLRVLSFFLFEHEGEEKGKKLNTKIIGEIGVDSKLTTKKLLDLIHSIASDNNLLADLNNNNKNNNNNNSNTIDNNSNNPTPTTTKKETKIDNEDLFSNCLVLLTGFVSSFEDCLSFFLAYPQLEAWLESVLITSPLHSLKKVISEKLFQISLLSIDSNQKLFALFDNLLKKGNISSSSNCYHFFVLFGRLIAEKNINEKQIEELTAYFYNIIKSLPVVERNSCSAEDEYMNGLMEVTRACVASYPSLKQQYGDSLIHEIFDRNLFEMPTLETRAQEGLVPPPRCKASNSRKIAFSFIQELASNNAANLINICTRALELQKSLSYQSSWSYLPQSHEKTSPYTGLENLGATCYMNSLMQQFFMNDAFRDRLLAVKKEEDETSMLYQLKTIFVNLLESEKSYYNPKSFCKVYKVDGEPMKTGIQMDVDEFFNMIMERIEQYLKGTNEEKMLNQLFGGEVVNQIISQECEHKVERTEPFLTVQIEVKGKNSVYESLDLFIQDDILDGDNKYECSQCKTKVNARKRCCINQLPNNLILHLKRFDFDLEFLRRSKITRSIEFPLKLNIEPYTKEGLERKEANLPSVNPLEHYDYVLTGILVHTGTTDSGHYYSFIKDRKTENWSKFNDETVTPFSVDNIPDTCYGGEYTTQSWDNQMQRQVTKTMSRPNSAYMLFYERVLTQNQVNSTTPKADVIATCQKIYEKVWEENLKFTVDKNLFEEHNVNFVQFMTSLAPKEEVGPLATLESVENNTMKVLELAITFLIQTYSHAKKKDSISEFAGQICELLKVHAPTSQWLLAKVAGDASWIRELFFYCSDKKVRDELIKVFVTAVNKVSAYETELFLEDDKITEKDIESSIKSNSNEGSSSGKGGPKDNIDDPSGFIPVVSSSSNSLTKSFINKVFSLYIEARTFWRNFDQYWQLFEEIARVNASVRSYMISKGYIRALLHFYLQEESPYYNGKNLPKLKYSERQPNENAALYNMKYLLSAVAVMVSGCSVQRHTENALPSPVSLEDITSPISFQPEDEKIIYNMKFFLRMISDGNNPDALLMLVTHLCWENQRYTDMFIEATYTGINRDTSERFPGYWPVIKGFICIQDSLQVKRTHALLTKLIDVINMNLNYPQATLSCLVFVVDLISLNSPIILDYFMQNRKWMRWVLFHKNDSNDAHEEVRFQAEKICLALVPDAFSYVTLKPKEGSQTEFEEEVDDFNVYPPQELNDLSKLKLNIILDELIVMFKDPMLRDMCGYEKPKSHNDEVVPKNGFKLTSLFRLLEWTFVSDHEKHKFISDLKVQDSILYLYKAIEKKEIENDYNKHYFFKLWDRLTDNNEAATNYFAASEEWCGAWISLREKPIGYNYINKSLYHFYRVLWKSSIHSDWFRQTFMNHSNFSWAFEFLYIKDTGDYYSTCAEYLFKMFEMYCTSDINFRAQWSTKFLKLGMDNRHKAWSKIFKTTLWILSDNEEVQMTFCKDGGLDYITTAFTKRETAWTPQDLTEILECVSAAVSWFFSAHNSGNTQLLNFVLERQKALLIRLTDLLRSIDQDVSEIGKLIHSILKDFYQVSDKAKATIIGKLLSDVQHQNKDPFNPKNDEWIAEHYISICELCSATPLDGDETIVESISDLVVTLLVKSLQLDNPFVTLRLLQLLLSLPDDTFLNKPELIQLYSGLTPVHFLNINENEAILFKFVSFLSDKFGTFIPELSQESLAEINNNRDKFVDILIQSLSSNQNESPEQHIRALITLKKALGPSFRIEREKLDDLNNLITKFSNEQTELVEEWKELYKNFK